MSFTRRDDLGPPVTVKRQRSPLSSRQERAATHQQSVVSLCVGGSATLDMGGDWHIAEGDVLIIPAGHPHRLTRRQEAEFISVGVCVPCMAATVSPGHLLPFERVRAGASPIVPVDPDRRAWLVATLGELERATTRPDPSPALTAALLTVVLDEVAQAWRGHGATSAANTLAHRVLRVIESRCLGPLTLSDVAAAVHRSPAHVTTVLSAQTGRSVGEWTQAFRLAEARRLLLHGDLAVEMIAERVGYNDVSHFIRVFRREHGVTPAAWRKGAHAHHQPRAKTRRS